MKQNLKKTSKYFSYILRHAPESIGLELDEQGWASIDELIKLTTDFELTPMLIQTVVETNDKQRFRLSEDGKRIKANQGHSIEVDLALTPIEPPEILFHGTARRFVDAIMKDGLQKMNRHHVHLSESLAVAQSVGERYGKPVIFHIQAKRMHEQGYVFYKTVNNVWLVNEVPIEFIDVSQS